MSNKPCGWLIACALISLVAFSQTSFAEDDSCAPYRQWLKEAEAITMSMPLTVPSLVQCVPISFCLTWDYIKQFKTTGRHYPFSTSAHYSFEESYPGRLELAYDWETRKRVLGFTYIGPSPDKQELVKVDNKAARGTFILNTPYEFHEYRIVSLSDPEDFKEGKREDAGACLNCPNFNLSAHDPRLRVPDSISKLIIEGSVLLPSNPDIEFIDFDPPPVVKDGIVSFKEMKESLASGELRKFIDFDSSESDEGGTFTRSGILSVDILVGLGLLSRDGKKEAISPDKYCPSEFEAKECYEIEVDCNLEEIKVIVKIHFKPKRDYERRFDGFKWVKDEQIAIYRIIHPKKRFIVGSKLKRLKQKWKREIESTWNEKFNLRHGKGRKVKVTFEARLVSEAEACHIVNVLPGEGRSDVENWYAKEEEGVAAHEFGHLLGLDDEYAESDCPGRPDSKDPSIMNDYRDAPRSKHFKKWSDWLGKATGGAKWAPSVSP